jgi:hypothetical protein
LVDKKDKLKEHILPAIAAAAIQLYAVPASPPHFSLFLNMITMKILIQIGKNHQIFSTKPLLHIVSVTDK